MRYAHRFLFLAVPLGLLLSAVTLPASAQGVEGTGPVVTAARATAGAAGTPSWRSAPRLEISHGDLSAALVRSGQAPIPFGHEDEIRIVPGQRTDVRITGTNSALYTCSVTPKDVEVPETKALHDFLGKVGPLIPAILMTAVPGALPPGINDQEMIMPEGRRNRRDASAAERELIAHIERVDGAIYGPQGFRQAYLETLATLNQMRDTDLSPAILAEGLRDRLPCVGQDCSRLEFVDLILETLPALLDAKRRVDAEGGGVSKAPQVADSILSNAQKIIDAAHEAQSLALTVAHATDSIECDPVQVSRRTGRELSIAVRPRAAPELKRVAEVGPMDFKVTAMPRLRPSPAVGVSLLYAWNARYTRFGTTPVEGGERIVTTGAEDERVGYGLVLGLAWNDRLGPSTPRVRLWLPEITFNPTDQLKTIGVGGGVSLGIVKLGGGVVWNRHTKLAGQRVGELLERADLLVREDTYGRPRGYVSLSFMGWPPFLGQP